jgi:hypothetical protein
MDEMESAISADIKVCEAELQKFRAAQATHALKLMESAPIIMVKEVRRGVSPEVPWTQVLVERQAVEGKFDQWIIKGGPYWEVEKDLIIRLY